MPLGVVSFKRGRNGPITTWEGKPAFPARGVEPPLYDPFLVTRARPNPRGTVFFLEGLPLEEALFNRALKEALERSLPWKQVPYVPYGTTSWQGAEGKYTVDPHPGRGADLFLTPWGMGEEEVEVEAQEVAGVRIPAQRGTIPLTPPGETPAWIKLREATPLRWEFQPLPEEKREGPAKVRPYSQDVVVGYEVPVWPEGGKLLWKGREIPEIRWPYPSPRPVRRVYPPNVGEWILLEEKGGIYYEQEAITGHYGDETWISGYQTVRKTRWTYRLRHRETGEEVVVSFPHPVVGWAQG